MLSWFKKMFSRKRSVSAIDQETTACEGRDVSVGEEGFNDQLMAKIKDDDLSIYDFIDDLVEESKVASK